ncbi:beta-Ig-H3/fasciclin [Nitritalea halalkaliphila LW7]|uniref:Beta-Ig-H3/fasciclin n=1 Tax=Nitritalea halalkaliphila LW7 TaxID=1189621 RepID=I5C2W1_9BACT|nr:fasciclin domain-containing protein [Nitritalea halalkaliphila]EIM76163.1 beta-Ig-H3/fasciclin [Nitritalea halalkaliphila LW7]
MKKLANYLLAGTLFLSFFACSDEEEMTPPVMEEDAPNLVTAAQNAGLTTLLAAVEAAGVGPTLLQADEITVFAPSNEAFAAALAAFDANDLGELVATLGGVENLETVLAFHVVPSVAFAADLQPSQMLPTLSGQEILVERSGDAVTVTDAVGNTFNVIAADVEIENGVVHVIDGVLLPELGEMEMEAPSLLEAATEAGLSNLILAVTAAGIADDLAAAEAITVFAPNDEAFANALEAFNVSSLEELVVRIGGVENLETVLGFHVVPAVAFSGDLQATNTFTTLAGQELTVNVANGTVTVVDAAGNTFNVVTADVAIENGVVHVIDGVLLPELTFPTVVEAATAAGLTVLLDAVMAANLGETLLGAEAITVFAPTNEAFAALLEEQNVADLEGLVELLGLEEVVRTLGFHVVPTVAFSFDLAEARKRCLH